MTRHVRVLLHLRCANHTACFSAPRRAERQERGGLGGRPGRVRLRYGGACRCTAPGMVPVVRSWAWQQRGARCVETYLPQACVPRCLHRYTFHLALSLIMMGCLAWSCILIGYNGEFPAVRHPPPPMAPSRQQSSPNSDGANHCWVSISVQIAGWLAIMFPVVLWHVAAVHERLSAQGRSGDLDDSYRNMLLNWLAHTRAQGRSRRCCNWWYNVRGSLFVCLRLPWCVGISRGCAVA